MFGVWDVSYQQLQCSVLEVEVDSNAGARGEGSAGPVSALLTASRRANRNDPLVHPLYGAGAVL
jgi:hypothetical protein